MKTFIRGEEIPSSSDKDNKNTSSSQITQEYEESTGQQLDPVQTSEGIPNPDQQANPPEGIPNPDQQANPPEGIPNPDQQASPPEGMVDMLHVENIRKFFDHKAECFRSDKLSQAYIITTFAEGELWEYVNKTLKVADEHKDEYQINIDDLRLMFQAYCQDPKFSPTLKYPKESWKIHEKEKLGELYSWLKKTPPSILLSCIWKNFISLSFLGTAAVFVWNTPVREQQKYFQAWQVINTAQNQSGTGGRNEALNYLNGGETIPFLNWAAPQCKKNNTCLVGIKITKAGEEANLNNIDLENANLQASVFSGTSFRGAKLKFAKFIDADLTGAVFKGADLKGVVFTGADLTGADFTKVKNLDDKSFENTSFCRKTMPNGKVTAYKCKQ
jgi:uncharacterized protein YjbI with pentapeptide repeats